MAPLMTAGYVRSRGSAGDDLIRCTGLAYARLAGNMDYAFFAGDVNRRFLFFGVIASVGQAGGETFDSFSGSRIIGIIHEGIFVQLCVTAWCNCNRAQ